MPDRSVYNSRDPRCKTPYGAVPSGTKVQLTLRPLRAEGFSRATMSARFEFRDDATVTLNMPWSGLDGARDLFTCTLDIGDYVGLVWYSFGLERLDGKGRKMFGPYQLTVYDGGEVVPEWFGEGTTYQIFPDRFRRTRVPDPQGMVGGRWVHTAWQEEPEFRPDKNGEIRNRDFFGGDLMGVMEKLDYLRGLGVETLYFCPIFEAAENHRYGTADYSNIDPMLGTEEDFTQLCQMAHQRGMRVMLDGVFNHTGYVSRYFNGDGFYPTPGACQSEDSPYRSWFNFIHWPDQYESWWGIYSLPAVNEHDPSYREFIFGGKDSVVRRWLRAGADGWRLDVADELPDDVLRDLRTAAKQADPDSVLLGEVWEDAVTKVSYGARRQYALGDALDSVMNYPLRDALIAFLTGRSTARALADLLLSQRLNYPQPLYYALMNLTASHDVARTRSALALDFDPRSRTRAQLAALDVTDAMAARGAQLQPLAAAVQFWLPGIPSIYYGDEAGMQGLCDPFNRAPLQMCDTQMLQWYAKLSALRHAHPALQRGEIAVFAPAGDVVCILRIITGGHDAFGAEAGDEALLLAVNRAAHTVRCHVELTCPGAGLNEETRLSFVRSSYDRALECVTGARAAIHDGVAAFDLPPRSAQIYRLENRHGTETGS